MTGTRDIQFSTEASLGNRSIRDYPKLGVGEGALMVGRIWLRCSWRLMAFNSWEVLTKRILDPTASKIWGSGQMWAGFGCFEIGVSVRGCSANIRSSPRSGRMSSSKYSPGHTTVAEEGARRVKICACCTAWEPVVVLSVGS